MKHQFHSFMSNEKSKSLQTFFSQAGCVQGFKKTFGKHEVSLIAFPSVPGKCGSLQAIACKCAIQSEYRKKCHRKAVYSNWPLK